MRTSSRFLQFSAASLALASGMTPFTFVDAERAQAQLAINLATPFNETHEPTHRIYLPGFGNPYGVVFVSYDADGVDRVVTDQGDFHGSIDPRNGNPLR